MLTLRPCDMVARGVGILAGWSDEFSGGKGLGRRPPAPTSGSASASPFLPTVRPVRLRMPPVPPWRVGFCLWNANRR